jgi:hypothetical protein
MTIVESIIVIVTVLALAVTYTVIYMDMYKEAIRLTETEKECCPSSEEDNE